MAEGSNPMTDLHTLIYEVEKRNKAGESLDGLRSDILRYLIAFRETPTGAAAISQYAKAYFNGANSVDKSLEYVANTPEQLENLAAALSAAAAKIRVKPR
jgi:hypothetical protein